MLISDLQLFNELSSKIGNRYVAVQYVSYAAREFAKKLPRYIIESYLIHWVLTGENPNHIHVALRENADIRFMNDILSWIEDDAVSNAVRQMYSDSVKARHLVYKSAKSLETHQQDRAKILLRMIWYQFD